MSEELWNALQAQLALERPQTRLCVGCWYRTHKRSFPDHLSSGLCSLCRLQTRVHYEQQRLLRERNAS